MWRSISCGGIRCKADVIRNTHGSASEAGGLRNAAGRAVSVRTGRRVGSRKVLIMDTGLPNRTTTMHRVARGTAKPPRHAHGLLKLVAILATNVSDGLASLNVGWSSS